MPNTEAEKLFTIIAEMAGGLIFGLLAGTLNTMIVESSSNALKIKEQMEDLRLFLRKKQVQKERREEVCLAVDQMMKKQGPSRRNSASLSVRRALLTPQAKPGSLYRRGSERLRAACSPRWEARGPSKNPP